MRKMTVMDEARLRHEFRSLYKDLGPVYCAQIMYEFLLAAEVLGQVMLEEHNNEES